MKDRFIICFGAVLVMCSITYAGVSAFDIMFAGEEWHINSAYVIDEQAVEDTTEVQSPSAIVDAAIAESTSDTAAVTKPGAERAVSTTKEKIATTKRSTTNKTVTTTKYTTGSATKSTTRSTTRPTTTARTGRLQGFESEMLAAVNRYRTAAGVSSVSMTTQLNNVAASRAKELVRKFDHVRPDGSTCFTILQQNGITYMSAGENIAKGQNSVTSVMSGWYNSKPHRENMLKGSFSQVGFGCYIDKGTCYWVQVFLG